MAAPAPSRLVPGPRRPLTRLASLAGLLSFHWTVYRRVWKGGLVSRFLTPVLFLAAMGIGVGSLVDRSSGGVGGIPYLQYVVPGLLMASVMQWAVGESTWPVMTYLKWNQMYAAMLTAPTRVADVVRAHWIFILAGIAWGSAVFIAVAALAGGVRSWWALLAVPISLLVALAFAAPLFWVAARFANEESFTTIFRLVITPLMLFSGTFFPLDQLPGWLQPVAWVTPLWHGTELARAACLGDPLANGWWLHLGVLAAYILIGYRLTLGALTRRLAS